MLYVRSLTVRMDIMRDEIERQRALLEPTTVMYREGAAASAKGDALENGVIRLRESIAEYCTELVEYIEQRKVANDAIMRLDRREHIEALSGHYLRARKWEELCVEMGYSWRGMMNIRKAALCALYDFMPEQWRRDAIPNAQPGKSAHKCTWKPDIV